MTTEQRKEIMTALKNQAKLEDFKRRFRCKLKTKGKYKKYAEITPPRYDEVYFRGIEWLDSL